MSKYRDDIIRLRDLGYSYSQIVQELGCNKSTVCYYLGTQQPEKRVARQKSRRDKIQKFIQEYKQGKPCTDCGEYYPYWMMDFDHLRDKLFGISGRRPQDLGLDLVKAEIEKCELVCANCHRNRTFMRQQGPFEWTQDFYE